MEETKLEWLESFLKEKVALDSSSISSGDGETTSYFESQEEDDYNTTSHSEEESLEEDEEGRLYIFKDENPYKVVEMDEEKKVYQVIGNEIIVIAKAEGVCCLCAEINNILFVDNSYGGNHAAQLCLKCIHKILGDTDGSVNS